MPLPYRVGAVGGVPPILPPAWRSMSAATDAIGTYHFNDTLFVSAALRREGHAPPLQREAGAHRGMGKMRAFFLIFLHFLHAPRMRLHPAPNARGWVAGFADQISR